MLDKLVDTKMHRYTDRTKSDQTGQHTDWIDSTQAHWSYGLIDQLKRQTTKTDGQIDTDRHIDRQTSLAVL